MLATESICIYNQRTQHNTIHTNYSVRWKRPKGWNDKIPTALCNRKLISTGPSWHRLCNLLASSVKLRQQQLRHAFALMYLIDTYIHVSLFRGACDVTKAKPQKSEPIRRVYSVKRAPFACQRKVNKYVSYFFSTSKCKYFSALAYENHSLAHENHAICLAVGSSAATNYFCWPTIITHKSNSFLFLLSTTYIWTCDRANMM